MSRTISNRIYVVGTTNSLDFFHATHVDRLTAVVGIAMGELQRRYENDTTIFLNTGWDVDTVDVPLHDFSEERPLHSPLLYGDDHKSVTYGCVSSTCDIIHVVTEDRSMESDVYMLSQLYPSLEFILHCNEEDTEQHQMMLFRSGVLLEMADIEVVRKHEDSHDGEQIWTTYTINHSFHPSHTSDRLLIHMTAPEQTLWSSAVPSKWNFGRNSMANTGVFALDFFPKLRISVNGERS